MTTDPINIQVNAQAVSAAELMTTLTQSMRPIGEAFRRFGAAMVPISDEIAKLNACIADAERRRHLVLPEAEEQQAVAPVRRGISLDGI